MPKFKIKVKPMFGDEFRDTGVVHDIVYHTWAREAMTKYVDQLDMPVVSMGRPTPVKMETEYKSPLLMSEEAEVAVRLKCLGCKSTTWETQINEANTKRPIATITAVQVLVDQQSGKAIETPEDVKQKYIDFEGRENIEVK